MQYWLLKSEPDVWSIDQQKEAGKKGAPWDGVRNYQAAKNLKAMKSKARNRLSKKRTKKLIMIMTFIDDIDIDLDRIIQIYRSLH